jgi:hypothetical protein
MTGGDAERGRAEADLVAAGAEPAAGGEVEGALGAGGGVEERELAVAVDPGAAHDQVVGRAVGRYQAEHLPCPPQLDPRPPCTPSHLSHQHDIMQVPNAIMLGEVQLSVIETIKISLTSDHSCQTMQDM